MIGHPHPWWKRKGEGWIIATLLAVMFGFPYFAPPVFLRGTDEGIASIAHRRLHRSRTVVYSRVRGDQDRYACSLGHDLSVLRDLRAEIVDED
jgi:hypothetical protein